MLVDSFRVDSPHVEYAEDVIKSTYEYQTTEFLHEQKSDGKYEWVARPKSVPYQFATQRKVPKLGYCTAYSLHRPNTCCATGIATFLCPGFTDVVFHGVVSVFFLCS